MASQTITRFDIQVVNLEIMLVGVDSYFEAIATATYTRGNVVKPARSILTYLLLVST